MSIAAGVAALSLSGCATRQHGLAGPANLHPQAAAQLGAGRYRYQFVLRDADGTALPNHPFALSVQGHRRLPFVADDKNVYQGTTDAGGRTPILALPFQVADADWRLRERQGAGPYGEDFRMLGPDDRPVVGVPYLIVVCAATPRSYRGRTNAQGFTAYVASDKPEKLSLFNDVAEEDTDDTVRETCAQ